MEDKIGSILVRKQADLVVLDRNLFGVAARIFTRPRSN
jgi:predicted amidohydrolase YtcJ